MDIPTDASANSSWASLRRFVRPRPPREHCELCAAELPSEHAHLVELSSRRLCCACEACAILFGSQGTLKYRRVPRRVEALAGFHLTEPQWESLHLPIKLAFFVHSTPVGRVLAIYPSPAGPTEAAPDPDVWRMLVEENPILRELEPDVEALLVNRLQPAAEYYRVGIDECYKLVGLVRSHWRGLSGGPGVRREIEQFFAGLRKRCRADG